MACSWGIAWGQAKQNKLAGAVRFAQDALGVDEPLRVDPSRAHFALANSYEDFALHLKCPSCYAHAQAAFEAVTDDLTRDPYQALKAKLYIWRVRFRRLKNDPSVTAEEREAWQSRTMGQSTVAPAATTMSMVRAAGPSALARAPKRDAHSTLPPTASSTYIIQKKAKTRGSPRRWAQGSRGRPGDGPCRLTATPSSWACGRP